MLADRREDDGVGGGSVAGACGVVGAPFRGEDGGVWK